MKHEKEWHTCDMCAKEIIHYNEYYAHINTEEIEPLFKEKIYTAEDLAKPTFPMGIWKRKHKYDLCPKCRKDFERFMRNENTN